MTADRDALRDWHRPRSEETSRLLGQLFESFQGEDFAMTYTMEDFNRDYLKKQFSKMTPQERRDILQRMPSRELQEALESLPLRERRELLQSLPPLDRRQVLESLPPEERLAGLTAEQIREYLDRLTEERPAKRKSRPKR